MNLDGASANTKAYLFSNSLVVHPAKLFVKSFNILAKLLPFHLIICFIKIAEPSKYQRKTSSRQFLIRAHTYFHLSQTARAKKCLKVALWLIGDDLPSRYKSLILKEFFRFLDDPNSHKLVSASLTSATQSLASEPIMIAPDTWFFLSRFFDSFAFMNASLVARERSVFLRRIEVLDEKSSRRQLEPVCAALLESLDLDRAKVFLNKFGQRLRPDKYLHFNFHLNLLTGSELCSEAESDDSVLGSVRNIRDLIRGKQVALVGPGSPVADFGHEVDQADLVFRIKFYGREFLLKNQSFGVRCDIAAYPNVIAQELLIRDGLHLDFFDGLKAVVVLNPTDSRSIQGIPIYHFDNLNSTYRYNDLTTGLRCLVNLLKLEPASVKLFGFDFYAGRELYDAERVKFYRDFAWAMGSNGWIRQDRSKSFSDRVRCFLGHDQLCNFILARNLYFAGRFEIEPFGASILSLSPSEYSRRIEHIVREAMKNGIR